MQRICVRSGMAFLALGTLWALNVGGGCVPQAPGQGGGVGTTPFNLPPIPVITSDVEAGVAPLTVAFSSTRSTDDGLIVSREWDFGDGSTSPDISPQHKFTATGTFVVSLSLTDNDDAVAVETVEIRVTEAPVANILVDRTTAANAPALFSFDASGSFDPDGEIVSFNWDFGDGSRERAEELTHTFATAGNFRVRLTVTDNIGITAKVELLIQVGIVQPAIEFRIPPPHITNLVVPQDGPLWVQAVLTFEAGVARTVRAGIDPDQDADNGNDIQLDADRRNGNDLNITMPTALRLRKVASIGGMDVPPGRYFVWAEIDTDRTTPTRVYANAQLHVVAPLTATVGVSTPIVPLVNDAATVLVDTSQDRQIFDLGPVSAGDRLFLSLTQPPAFTERFDADGPYSLMLLDSTQRIVAWFQRLADAINPFTSQLEPVKFVLFSRESRLVITRDSPNLYVVSDGGNSINVRIERATGLNQARRQRVFINFAGANDVKVGGLPATNVPALSGSDLNASWGPGELVQVQSAIMDQVRAVYANFDVEFVSSVEKAADPNQAPTLPFQTMHIGGTNLFDLGASDYVDPRNETQTGTGITFATSIAQDGFAGMFANPTNTPATVGFAIGNVAAHYIGHLLGLRHTDDVADLMSVDSLNDPSTNLVLMASLVTSTEQFDSLPAIGTQDAPLLLQDTIGLKPVP